MARDDSTADGLTRRGWMKRGGIAVASGLVAGCTASSSGGGDGVGSEAGTGSGADDRTQSPTGTSAQGRTTHSGSYSVAIEPVGSVEFERPPERIVGGWGFVADVLMALGHADSIVGLSRPGFWYQGFYEHLPSVEPRNVDEIPNTVSKSYSVKQELLYELDPDLLATDPNRFIASYQLEPSKVSTLATDVAPFFGNLSRSKRAPSWPNWPDGKSYRYYSIPEFVERYGRVVGERDRASAMIDLYERTMDDITSRVPPKGDRPSVGLLSAFTNPENKGYFGVIDPIPKLDKTYELKQYGDLGVVDAFADEYDSENAHYDLKLGMEGLLDVDPDVLVFDEAVNALGGNNVYGNANAYEGMLELLRTDPVGKQLTAVKNDRLYPGGTGSQGPIINLFQTEMLAKQLYPDEFGAWHGLGEIPANERLFDRQRLADIINGFL
ncbi:ABC transporter substrate-binding protein [Halococcus thailandensis]|uniref:Fe3+-hydroxamate ABC transporter substrate-binding protein n=1 Tax=Halococcus thailandensis JCM 13552 TaxID=1227457 RepID=M0N392_9EURY|nr:ABC transporter substrate-binding protein [Halococcus thailandensis]EMA51569.1 Fe3+-hydroxamate ABC transporter substrate-binding protein [Halococcus thailandensis JCM 13552]